MTFYKLTVTDIKNAARCMRYYILINKFKIKPSYKTHSHSLLIGNIVHNIVDIFIKRINSNKKFFNKIQNLTISDNLDRDLKNLIKDEFYKIFLNQFRKLIKKEISNWAIKRIWECVKNVSREFSKLIYKTIYEFNNIIYVKNIFRFSERLFEEVIKIDGLKILIRGKLDTLIFDPVENQIIIFEFKTGLNENFQFDIIQVALYSYLIKKNLGIDSSGRILYLGLGNYKPIDLGLNQIQFYWEKVMKIIKDINKFHLSNTLPPKLQLEHMCTRCWINNECDNF
ncbi:MAG: Dna2/Cas4 domain-containing protein [Promethearchaeota archaeon]